MYSYFILIVTKVVEVVRAPTLLLTNGKTETQNAGITCVYTVRVCQSVPKLPPNLFQG